MITVARIGDTPRMVNLESVSRPTVGALLESMGEKPGSRSVSVNGQQVTDMEFQLRDGDEICIGNKNVSGASDTSYYSVEFLVGGNMPVAVTVGATLSEATEKTIREVYEESSEKIKTELFAGSDPVAAGYKISLNGSVASWDTRLSFPEGEKTSYIIFNKPYSGADR